MQVAATKGTSGQPQWPSLVQHGGPYTALQFWGHLLGTQLPVLPPVPLPVHSLPLFVYPARHADTHCPLAHVT